MYTYEADDLLCDVRVLILEREVQVASDLTLAVSRAGGTVIGPSPSARDADDLLQSEAIDIAILGHFPANIRDLNFARKLEEHGIPIVFHVTSAANAWSAIFPDAVVMQKGASHDRIVAQLARLVEGMPRVSDFLCIDHLGSTLGQTSHQVQ